MNARSIGALVVGLIVVGVVGYMMKNILDNANEPQKLEVKADIPPTPPTIMVLVAKNDLVVGTFVRKEDLHWQKWPEDGVVKQYITQGGEVTQASGNEKKKLTIDDIAGGVVRLPVIAGQPMTPGLVAKAGERGFLAAVLRPGRRAVTVGVDSISGIAGFILPGDRVDMMWNVSSKETGGFTQTLMTDLRIIAIDQMTQANAATPVKTVTLEVTPKQAEAISVARSNGKLEFVLRSIAPEKKKEIGSEFGETMLVAEGGIEGGTLLAGGQIAEDKDKDEKYLELDSYTVRADLLYNPKGRPGRTTARQITSSGSGKSGSGKSGAGKAPAVVSSKARIEIVRGVTSTTVKVKK